MKSNKILAIAALISGIALFTYQILYHIDPLLLSSHPPEDIWYHSFEGAFLLADIYAGILCIIAAIGLWNEKNWGYYSTALAGSSAIFLGLMDVCFNLKNGIYLNLTEDVFLEIILNIWCLGLGSYAITWVWKTHYALKG